jgi:hypothetical protein
MLLVWLSHGTHNSVARTFTHPPRDTDPWGPPVGSFFPTTTKSRATRARLPYPPIDSPPPESREALQLRSRYSAPVARDSTSQYYLLPLPAVTQQEWRAPVTAESAQGPSPSLVYRLPKLASPGVSLAFILLNYRPLSLLPAKPESTGGNSHRPPKSECARCAFSHKNLSGARLCPCTSQPCPPFLLLPFRSSRFLAHP